MKDIGKDVLEKIREEGVTPYPRWQFILKRSLVWFFFGAAVVLSGMATGVALFQIRHMEWDVQRHISHSLVEFLVLAAPYFWLVFIFFFVGIAFYNFRKTEKGYKYGTAFVGGGSFLLSIIIGGLLVETLVPEKLDTAFEENLSFYRWAEGCRHRMWMAPENGFLAGEIEKQISGDQIEIRDLFGNPWQVDIKNAVFIENFEPEPHRRIKLIGKMEKVGRFTATEIRPFRCGFKRSGRGFPCGKKSLPCNPPFHRDRKGSACPFSPPPH